MENDDLERLKARRKRIAFGAFGGVVLAMLLAIGLYARYSRSHLSTDDAFVEGTVHTIASRVEGTVLRVRVEDNESLREGDLLVELDPELYEKRVLEAEAGARSESGRAEEISSMIEVQNRKIAAAEAALERTRLSAEEIEAAVRVREAEVRARRAVYEQGELDVSRAENLLGREVISKSRYDSARTAYETARAEFNAAEELRAQAEVSLRAQHSAIREAEAVMRAERAVLGKLRASLSAQQDEARRRKALRDIAGLNLSYTRIYAPSGGYVTRKSVEVGNHVKVGQPLMAIVSLADLHVIANYKETQVRAIRSGQRVRIKVDAYPGKIFWGKVDSVMAGTGSVFSLFPPENATGNYVKVVQRIPVKINIDETAPEYPLRVGMSVVPTILTQ
ncbi:MAG: HlyD family secretion protein [Thermodesulfovibrionales bacterium]